MITIREEPITALAEHGRLSIAFEVRSMLDVEVRDGGLGGFVLAKRQLTAPWIKDYDAAAENRPSALAQQFDVSKWGLLSAWDGATRVGGVIIAFDTASVDMLDGRKDLALIWDLRVAAPSRGQGVGTSLFAAAEAWARARGCKRIEVETQNINVPASRFYARMGCVLRSVDRFAYTDLVEEVQLVWAKPLV